MDVLVLRFLQVDSDIFQNEAYCLKTDTQNTLVWFQLWILGWPPTPRLLLMEGSIVKSMTCFLSELMFHSVEFQIYCVVVNGNYVDHRSPSQRQGTLATIHSNV